MAKVFRVTVIEKRGYKVDVEARDWADSIRKVRKAVEGKGLKRASEPVYEAIEVEASAEISRADADLQLI